MHGVVLGVEAFGFAWRMLGSGRYICAVAGVGLVYG